MWIDSREICREICWAICRANSTALSQMPRLVSTNRKESPNNIAGTKLTYNMYVGAAKKNSMNERAYKMRYNYCRRCEYCRV